MVRARRSERVNLRLPEEAAARIREYASSMGISMAEAVRVLVEDRLRELNSQRTEREHINRLIEIGEYLFSSTIAQNEVHLSPDRRQKVVDETAKALSEKYVFDDEEG